MAFAEAGCILKVDVHCGECKYTIINLLGSITGVYNVEVDGERGIVHIAGEVDPNILVRALVTTGRHAELIRANFKHPDWNSGTYRNHRHYGGRSNGYGGYDCYYDSQCYNSNYPFRNYNSSGMSRYHPVPRWFSRRENDPYYNYRRNNYQCNCFL